MDGYKSWLPEDSTLGVIQRGRWYEEAQRVRMVKCHSEPSLKEGGAGSSVLPSSCSATCRKCRDIPYSLFADYGPDLYRLYNNYHELSLYADAGCSLY